MQVTKVKKQMWCDDTKQFVAYTLVLMHLYSDSEINEMRSWFQEKFGDPFNNTVGRNWYPTLSGIAMDERIYTWYALQKQDEKA